MARLLIPPELRYLPVRVRPWRRLVVVFAVYILAFNVLLAMRVAGAQWALDVAFSLLVFAVLPALLVGNPARWASGSPERFAIVPWGILVDPRGKEHAVPW